MGARRKREKKGEKRRRANLKQKIEGLKVGREKEYYNVKLWRREMGA